MSEFVSSLLQWMNAHPELAGLVTFIISAAESVAIIGTIVPGSIMMTALGTLAGAGIIPLGPTIVWAILGAIVGDGISYWMGYYFKDRLPHIWPFSRYPGFLKNGERFFYKYGYMSVFIGRFVGPVRALVPLVAGMLGMKPLQFTIANVTSAIGWAPAYMLPGILLGAASLELPPDIAIHVILVLFLFFLFFMLCLWFIYKIFQLIKGRAQALEIRLWHFLERRVPSATYLLRKHDNVKPYGQLNLAFFMLLTMVALTFLVIYVKAVGPETIVVNDAIFHLFRGMRIPQMDHVMISITLLGQKEVIWPVIGAVFFWLFYKRNWRTAAHVALLAALTIASVHFLKNYIQSPRPFGLASNPYSFSMPSGHATLSMTIFMGLAFLIAGALAKPLRLTIYSVLFCIAFLVGVSRLYLGAHWFTDVISGWLLSAILLSIVIISYQHRKAKRLHPYGMMIVGILTLTVSFTYYYKVNYNQLMRSYTPLSWPTASISMNEWWAKDHQLPAYRASLFGFPSQPINIQWVGELGEIRDTLAANGWTKPPARDFISTLHRVADIKSTKYLPLVSLQYLDKKPALILTRQFDPNSGLLVLRLWDSNRRMQETGATLWVGLIGFIPRSYSWL